jgi:hypothetical protein
MKIYRLFISFLIILLLSLPVFLPWKNLAVFSSIIKTEFNLVAVLVDPYLLNNTDLSNKISRYATDVQNSYEKTKVIIVPVNIEKNTNTSEKIYRLLENWYFSGLKQDKNKYFLTGTILIGDVTLPKLISPVGDIPSIYPYTDFKDPVFIWDTEELKWIKNSESNFTNAEIWHGMIVGTKDELLKYFDKNHKTHVDLKKGDSKIKDKILFWDAFAESESSYPLLLGQYENGLKIMGDRKEFRYLKSMNLTGLDFSIEDIPIRQLRNIVEKFSPKYAEVVKSYELDVQQIVHNTGRWEKTDMDSVPAMISVIDEYVANEIKKMNTEAADKIYNLFSSSARPISIAKGQYGRRPLLQSEYDEWKIKQEERDEEIESIKRSRSVQIANMRKNGASDESITDIENGPLPERIEIPEYKDVEVENYLYGRNISGISSADQCTIYKGTQKKGIIYPYKTYYEWEKYNEKFLEYEVDITNNDSIINQCFNIDHDIEGEEIAVKKNSWEGIHYVPDIISRSCNSSIFNYDKIHNSTISHVEATSLNPIEWKIKKNEGGFLNIFIPPGVKKINMAVNGKSFAASQLIRFKNYGEYECHNMKNNIPVLPNASDTSNWIAFGDSRSYSHIREAKYKDKSSCMLYGFYNLENKNYESQIESLSISYEIDNEVIYKNCENWKNCSNENDTTNLFVENDDIGIFFNKDPLQNSNSVQVEFNKVHEFKNNGGNCKSLGGCCSSNDSSKCMVSKAILPIFSWQGGENSLSTGVKLIDSEVPSRNNSEDPETSGEMCKVFNFTEPDIYSSPEEGKLQSANKLYGKVTVGSVGSLQMHGHPSEKYDQSLKNTLSNQFAKDIPINKNPYIDMMIGDNIFQEYTRIYLPDFFRFKYNKLSNNSLQTKHELSEFALYFDRRIVGGDSVINKNKQYGNSIGLAVMPMSFRTQKIIHYKKDKVKKSESFAIYDDNNNLPIDYALPLTMNIENMIGGGVTRDAFIRGNESMVDFVESLEKEKINMENLPNFNPNSILYKSIDYKINHIKPQVDMTRDYSNIGTMFDDNSIEAQMERIQKKMASLQEEQKKYVSGNLNGTRAASLGIPLSHKIFLNFAISKEGKHHGLNTWEANAISSVGSGILSSFNGGEMFSTRVLKISSDSRLYGQLLDPENYFLHNNTDKNFEINKDLNEFLIPLYEIKEEYFKNTEYKIIHLSKNNPPFWLSEELVEKLQSIEGELYLEVSEVLAVHGENFPSGLPLGGETYIKENKLILPNKGKSSDPRHNASGTIKMTESTSLVFPAKEKTYFDPEEEYERYEVTRDMFYNSAVVENSTDCNGTCHRLLPYIYPAKLTKADTLSLTQSVLNSKTTEELDFLFRWKDMTDAEKHHAIQKVLLDKNDKSIKGLNKDPYAYVHWRVTGDTHPIWEAEDGKLSFDEISDLENDPQTEVDNNRKKPESSVEQDEKCAPLEGVPIHKWIPSVLCWVKEVKNVGIEFKHECALQIDEFKGLFSDALKDEIKSVEIEPSFNPLISGVENVVGIAFFTENKEYAKGKRVHFTVFLEGADPTNLVPDQDSEKEGIQLSDADGLEQIEIIPNSEIVKIIVEATYNGQTLKTEKILKVEGDQSFIFEEINTELINNIKSYTFKIKPNKKIETFEGKIHLQVKPSSEVVISKDSVKLDEEFSVAVRTDKEVILSASLRGVKVAIKKLQGEESLNSDIETIKIPDLPNTVSFFQTLELPVKFYNGVGTEKKIREEDIKYLKIKNYNNKDYVSFKIIKKEHPKTKDFVPYLKIKTANTRVKLNFSLELSENNN